MDSEVVEAVLEREVSATFEVPLAAWRHFLRFWRRNYLRFGELVDEFKGRPEHQVLTFCVDGVDYADEKAIPGQSARVHLVGSFELQTPEMVAIDPCYADAMQQGVRFAAPVGTWTAHARLSDAHNGFGVAVLCVTLDGAALPDMADVAAYEHLGYAGVDSGMCGFFQLSTYPREARQHEHEPRTWYRGCCDAIECKVEDYESDLIFPVNVTLDGRGANSQTMRGDGSYSVRVRHDAQGRVDAAMLVFDHRLLPDADQA